MANRKIEFTTKQIAEIQEARKSNKNKNVDRRLRVLALKIEGQKTAYIAEQTEFHPVYTRELITKYFREGLQAIIGKKRTANRRNISLEEETEFLRKFKEKADRGELVTVKEIKIAYCELIGHKCGKGQIYRVLARHGWRKIKPRQENPKKASEAEIEASKKLTMSSGK